MGNVVTSVVSMEKKSKSIDKAKEASKQQTKPKPQARWRAEKEARGDFSSQKGVPLEDIEAMFKEYREQHLANIDSLDKKYLTSRRFFLERGHVPETVYEWMRKYPHLRQDYDLVQRLIGDKREAGMMLNQLNEKPTTVFMHKYLPDWHDAEKREDGRKIEVQTAIRKATLEEENKNLDAKISFFGLGMKAKPANE